MKKINNVLAVSIIAMMAVPAAHAKIVSQSNVIGGDGVSVNVPTEGTNAGKLVVSGNLVGDGGISVTAGTDANAGKLVISGSGLSSGKQDKLTSSNVVAGTATGNVVTSITASDGTVTVNKASGVIKDVDIASDAAIAKSKLADGVQTSLGLADTAVQSVALASGTNNGTVKLTVNGTETDNIAVKGLGGAAYEAVASGVSNGGTGLTTSDQVYDAIQDNAINSVASGTSTSGFGTILADGNAVTVYGLGTAAGGTIETTGVSANTTTLPTTAQVKSYVDTAVSGANNTAAALIEDSITDGVTNKAPSENAVHDELAKKQNIQIGAAGVGGADSANKDEILIVDADGKITLSNSKIGSAAYAATTDFDAAGAASGVQTAIEGKLDDGASGYNIDANTLKIKGKDVKSFSAGTGISFGTADADGVVPINSTYSYSLPIATDSVLGGVKEGSTVDIDANGVINVKDATSSQKGVAQLAADVQNTTAVNTTAENVSNKVGTVPSDWSKYTLGGSEEQTGQALYPSMYATQEMISSTLSNKVNTTEGTQQNTLMVRNNLGRATKDSGSDISVTTENGLTKATVTHATKAEQIPSGSGAGTGTPASGYALIWVE